MNNNRKAKVMLLNLVHGMLFAPMVYNMRSFHSSAGGWPYRSGNYLYPENHNYRMFSCEIWSVEHNVQESDTSDTNEQCENPKSSEVDFSSYQMIGEWNE